MSKNVPASTNQRYAYRPASASEALRLERQGYEAILEPKIQEALVNLHKARREYFNAQRGLSRLIRDESVDTKDVL